MIVAMICWGHWRAWLALLIVTLSSAGCRPSSPSEPHLVEHVAASMGTEIRLTAWTRDEAVAGQAFARAFAEFNRLDRLLSVWQADSDVLRINAAAGRQPVAVAADTMAVLLAAQQLHALTNGKFDITFGALADIWKFDHDQDNVIPTPAQVAARLPFVDASAMVLDQAAGTAFVTRPGVRVHLGGIGKGYAVDKTIAILRAAGLQNFMVQAGGDLYVAGQRGDRPWRLGVNDPRGGPNDSFATIELRDRTFSTSGDYERFFIADGVRYHHLLDPGTGQPSRACRSVTIVATTATQADGLSKGVFLLGPVAGMALVERLPEVEAVIVTAQNEVLISRGLQGRVHIDRPPTDVRP